MIVANGAVHLTVLNFQSDPIAKVVLANETRAPILWNDGNGGSVLSTWSGGIIHFVGEVVPASQIVSSVQPVMAFTAAAAPSPAPDPPPPAAPADPPPTVHNVTDTAYFQGSGVLNGQPPTANDGDTFHLPANNVSLTLAGLANTMTFVTGSGDQVYESYPTGPATITDNGSGLTLTINEPVGSPTMQHMISVIGFGTDLTATLRVDTGNWWTGLPPTIAPDGNGGSIIGGFVDLVGIATPNLAQIQAYRAYA
jgi:hypothetical protein